MTSVGQHLKPFEVDEELKNIILRVWGPYCFGCGKPSDTLAIYRNEETRQVRLLCADCGKKEVMKEQVNIRQNISLTVEI